MTTPADRLAEAARLRLVKGHNDTCQHALLPDYPCNCGHDALVAALTAYRSAPPVDLEACARAAASTSISDQEAYNADPLVRRYFHGVAREVLREAGVVR